VDFLFCFPLQGNGMTLLARQRSQANAAFAEAGYSS
jgi:hypothetical protein